MDTILSLRNITKIYPGVVALDDFSIDFERGEVHALLGENGAGKSTLIKTITGAIAPDNGKILVDGREFSSMDIFQAKELGIEVIYQERNLIRPMTASENIWFGKRIGKTVDRKAMIRMTRELFDKYNIDIDPATKAWELSNAQQQLVEIMKAVSRDARFIIMDEPTASLTDKETEMLFRLIDQFKARGVTIIYISHRLNEVFRLADRVTIMRDGKYIQTLKVADANRQELVNLMVGRTLSETYPRRDHEVGEEVLRVDKLNSLDVYDISFSLRRGEILGLGGLVGAGRTEVARLIYGADERTSGAIYVKGELMDIRSTSQAMASGIGMVPEERKTEGVFLRNSIRWNISINNIRKFSNGIWVDNRRIREAAESFRKRLAIKTPTIEQIVNNLSGGNQQKVALAKTLSVNSDIVIIDEPTRGIDVGAKHEIYMLMRELAREGKAIIMITSDMEELLGMSDRIVVLHEGTVAGELQKDEFSQSEVLRLASGL